MKRHDQEFKRELLRQYGDGGLEGAVAGFQKALAIYGGGGWIRTIEGIASRFTVCPG